MPTEQEVKQRIGTGEWWALERMKVLYREAEGNADWYTAKGLGVRNVISSDLRRLMSRGLIDAIHYCKKDGTFSRNRYVYRINERGLAHGRNDAP